MNLVPITLTDAHEFTRQHHRHHAPAQGGLFAVAVEDAGVIVGVCVIGRPVARMLHDGYTAEVTRLATNGARNACSMLYAAAWRACRALGYRRLVTYTLKTESGASLRATGFRVVGEVSKRSWHCPSRPRVDKDERQERLRWELSIQPRPEREEEGK